MEVADGAQRRQIDLGINASALERLVPKIRPPDIDPSCGERLLGGYGEAEAEVTAGVVGGFCVQFLTHFRQGFRAMWR
jgi:hypothetical protein